MGRIIFLILTVILLFAGAVYVWNPSGTASANPRARLLGFDTYRISAASNAPTLMEGDIVFAETFVYKNRLPEIGDMVVFRKRGISDGLLMKRVVALPGNRIRVTDWTVFIDDQPLQEPYVMQENNKAAYSRSMAELTVSDGMMFLLGDNRDNSRDSRFFGVVPVKDLVGRVVLDE